MPPQQAPPVRAPGAQPTIGDWTSTILTKFIQDLLRNQPPDFLPLLKAENVQVSETLTLLDKLVTANADFKAVGKPGNSAFEHTWANFGGGWGVAAYYRDILGWVHLRGIISSGTVGQSALTLPPGYWPAVNETFSVISNNAIGRVDVQTNGQVIPQSPSSNIWVSLSGIQFRTT